MGRSACLTKLDSNGAIVWNRGYKIDERSRGVAVRRATDNPDHYVMVGHSDTLVGANQKIFLMKTDDLGNPLWTQSYGEAPGRVFRPKMELRNVEDGGYIVCGSVDDGLVGLTGFLLRVDDNGALMWMRFYPQPGVAFNFNEFHDVQTTAEGFVVTGFAPSQFPPGPAQNSLDTLVMTTDAFGNPIWAKQYANVEGNQGGESITVLPQGYAVVGGHLPTMLDGYTTEIFTIDASGGLQWYNRMFGAMDAGSHYKNQQVANGTLSRLSNGDLIFVGGDYTDAALFRFDALGNYVTGQTYGQINSQWGASYVIEPSGFFTMVGPHSTGLDLDYYVVRADASFMSGCNENEITPPIDNPPIEVVNTLLEPVDVFDEFEWVPIDVPLAWNEIVLCQSNPCVDPFTVACTLASGDVTLNWGPAQPLITAVEVRRNGVLQASLPGVAITYTDTSPFYGTNLYEITLIHLDSACDRATASCSKFVGLVVVIGTATDVIFKPWKPKPDEPIICWADNLETKGRTPLVISNFAEISPELGSDFPGVTPIVWLWLGEFPDQYELTDEDGQILAEYLASGGSLYVEGGDVGFGPPTMLSTMDGVVATDSGANNGTLQSLTGIDSGVGLDASGLSSAYTGSGRSVDHLAPDGNGAGPIFANAGGEGQVTGVYYDAAQGGAGNHRVITSSTTIEGYAGDNSALLDAYLAALSPPPTGGTAYVRGDCNADGATDIGDAITGLGVLFSGASVTCTDACDTNSDGGFDIADAISLLSFLFSAGPPPSDPFPNCGGTVVIGCDSFAACP